MTYRTFTEPQILAIEEIAAKRFEGRTLVVELGHPILESLAVAPLTRTSYADLVDEKQRDVATANHNIYISRLLSHGLVEAEQLRQRWPAAPEKVAEGLEIEAGARGEYATCLPFLPKAPPPGLSLEEAEKLASSSRTLWHVESKAVGLSVILETPMPDVWLAARAAYDAAVRAKSGIITAIDDYVLPAIKLSLCGPLTGGSGLLDRKPGLIMDFRRAYTTTGGDGAAVRTKSLRA